MGSERADLDSLEVADPKVTTPPDDMEEKVDDLADLMGGLGVKVSAPTCAICLEVLTAEMLPGTHCTDCARRVKMAKTFEGMKNSTKVSRLLELLDEIASESPQKPKKTIVFSQVGESVLFVLQIRMVVLTHTLFMDHIVHVVLGLSGTVCSESGARVHKM